MRLACHGLGTDSLVQQNAVDLIRRCEDRSCNYSSESLPKALRRPTAFRQISCTAAPVSLGPEPNSGPEVEHHDDRAREY
jgi:hypothetical protein